jgi:hypothetical protein
MITMRKSLPWLFLAAFLLPSAASAEGEKEKARALMSKAQMHASVVLVDYCRERAPETNAAMDAAMLHFRVLMDEAMQAWIARNPGMQERMEQQAMDPDAEAKLDESLVEIKTMLLELVAAYDPHVLCQQSAERFQAATLESVTQQLEDYDRRVQEVSRREAEAEAAKAEASAPKTGDGGSE